MTTRPLYLLITIILPLASFFIFWTIFKSGVPTDLPISVYDGDNTQTSRRISRMLDSTSLLDVVQKVTSIDQGKKLMLRGDSYALVVLPKNMEKDILRRQSPEIINFYNNEFLLIGSLINKDITTVIKTVSKGLNLSMRQKQNEMTTAAMAHIEPLSIKKHVLFNPYLNYFYYLTGTLQPTMLQLFIIIMAIFAFGIELKDGTAGELFERANGNLTAIIVGKLLPYSIIYILLGLFMNIYLFRIPGFPFRGNMAVLVLATILFVFAYQAIGVLIISVTANLRMSLSMAGFYSATAFAFGGVTFPAMGMPLFAKIWSSILPLTHYIKVFVDQSIKGVPLSVSIPDLCYLSFFIIAGFTLSCFRMKKILIEPLYWGRS
ncbi:MAG: ABC transporter permease [Desulfobacteraceae bacterium]|nr:ABC transporter permease [Desulfobacteraceae bacterium]